MRKLLFLFIVLLLGLPMMAAKSYTVVLDAGHGGKDPGAVGRISKEKDLNLKLALQVGKLLKEQYPDVKVVFTRATDVFIPLQQRADIANKNNADLFISIHTNSSESKTPCGVETFILGTEKMEQNLDVAMRENAVMKLEADYQTTYQGFDPNSIDSYIMFELMQNSHMDQSLDFASRVQSHFVGQLNREDRGVRQAAFWVLLKTACPSILFEMGFISNPDEEKYLNAPGTIDKMAQGIVKSFGEYTHRQAVKQESLSTEQDKPAPQSTNASAPSSNASAPSSNASAQPANANSTSKEQPSSAKSADPQPTVNRRSTDGQSQGNNEERTPILYYAVQICASRTPLEPSDPRLKGLEYDTIQVGEWIKYYTAADPDKKKVSSSQQQLKPRFPDCWIIKFEK
ncbi:MAG: N-acetylmuramoyl-L-alanine amidase [Paludibacteraceae bacterium]|nr:N-acetylmuramoyl-L-alanine amidase [Paludibacteraceae bacterium]